MTVFVMQLQSNLKNIEGLVSQSRWSYRKPRTVSYRYNQDKLMHRLGGILVQYGIQHDTGLLSHEWHYRILPRGEADIVQYNHDGQPIYVSLSYSYPYIVCAVDKEPVGIDIEKMSQRLDWCTLVTCLSTNEAHQICGLNDFCQAWTQKESFTKLIGGGLIKGLDIYDMTQSHFYQSRKVEFKQFAFDQFMVQVCLLG